MTRPDEEDRSAVDRAFAEMVAGYHLTADRPSPELGSTAAAGSIDRPASERDAQPAAPEQDAQWADHPLFRFPAGPEPERCYQAPGSEPYVPDPLPPLHRPGLAVLLGWLGIGWAVLVVLSAAFGARFPGWIGWLAVLGFLGGFTVLISQLLRHRPPDAGDGAVL